MLIKKKLRGYKVVKSPDAAPPPAKRYWPLVVLGIVAAIAAFAITFGIESSWHRWMHYFMGLLFCQYAMLKLFNLSQFADGFQKYDLLAMNFRGYAYLYPLIEIGLGLAYLSFCSPLITYSLTIIVTTFSALGVIKALKTGLNMRCACMGTVLNVPLSTVTLIEDLVMGSMACLMLVQGF